MRFICLVFLTALVVPAVSTAQSPATVWPLDPGELVRVTSPASGNRQETGIVVSTVLDTLIVQGRSRQPQRLAVRQLRLLEVANGRHTNKLKHMLIGFGGGVLGGSLIGAAFLAPKPGDFFYNSPGEARMTGAFFGGVLGGVVGAIVGVAHGSQPRDTWVPVTFPR